MRGKTSTAQFYKIDKTPWTVIGTPTGFQDYLKQFEHVKTAHLTPPEEYPCLTSPVIDVAGKGVFKHIYVYRLEAEVLCACCQRSSP